MVCAVHRIGSALTGKRVNKMAFNFCNYALCWSCGNATGGCSWSDGLEPVRGSESIEERGGRTVIRCPEYKRDSFGDGIYRDGNEYYRIISRRAEKMEIKRKG